MMKLKLIFIIVTVLFISFSQLNAEVLWADKVVGFSSQSGSKELSANQILGFPSVMPGFGLSSCAWMPVFPTKKFEWVRIKFSEFIKVKQILINENLNPGAVIKVILYDSTGSGYTVYSNNNPAKQSSPNLLNIFPKDIQFVSNEMKIEVNTINYYDRYQIDAVAISDEIVPIKIEINETQDFEYSALKENLGKKINSKYRELAPIISQDGQTLFFTREGHPNNFGPLKKQDVWYSKSLVGVFTESMNIGSPINNDNINFAISISPDGNKLLLGNIYLPNGEVRSGFSFSTFNGQSWSKPDSLKIEDFYNYYETGSYNLSSNGKILLMAVKRDDSFGKTDIYVSFLQDNGIWSKPKNIGKNINTAEEEISPFLASDLKTLYFSTSGHPGYGETDMFMSRRLDDTWELWTDPVNLGKNINTSGWDAYYSITASGDYAYFVSSENSIGSEDIFRLKLPETLKPEKVVLVKGEVVNAETAMPLSSKITYEILPEGKEAGSAISNAEDGKYQIILPAGKKYGFRAEADGFISSSEFLDLQNLKEYTEINRDLYLAPEKIGVVVRINNIFFEFAKFELLEDSFAELNRLITFLNENPTIKLRIIGHTDNIGNDRDNLILSEKRAEAVANYLIQNSIDRKRLKIKGFGRTKPIAENTTEEGRQKNRRVEFEILEK